jgi:FG-GAP repeat
MKKITITCISLLLVAVTTAQTGNVGIGTTSPTARLHINHKNTAGSPSLILFDSAAGTGSKLLFSKQNQGTNFSLLSTIDVLSANSSLDMRTTFNSGIFLRGDGRVGINNITNPAATLHVGGGMKIQDTLNAGGDINIEGKLKINGNTGAANQVLVSKGAGASQTWENINSIANGSGAVGFGTWGDCSMNGISEYNPVADTSGALNDLFGHSVSISGNYAIIGACKDDDIAGNGRGSASIFKYNGINWVFMQKITDATGTGYDDFGNAVSISGNYAIVGARFDDGPAGENQGSASIYQLIGGTWVLMQKIRDVNGSPDDYFGWSVSISDNKVIVGAPNDDAGILTNRGSASIYQLSGGTWVLMNKITDATGATDDNFGWSVSISGNYVIVGAPHDDGAIGANQGSVCIYQLSGGTWALMNKITDVAGGATDCFGSSVSISGNCVIVGAPSDDDAQGPEVGSVISYQLNGSTWVPTGKFGNVTRTAYEHFGTSVSLSGAYAVVGTSTENATIYMKVGLAWRSLQIVTDPAGSFGDEFGSSTAIDAVTKRFLIGAPYYASASGKVIFGKIN